MVLNDPARARIARGWLNSSLDQPAYAAMHGISTRTLRDWVCRYGGGRRPQAQLRAAVVASIEQLQNVLAVLDAEAAADSASATEDGEENPLHEVERHAAPPGPAAPTGGSPPPAEAEPLLSRPTVSKAARLHTVGAVASTDTAAATRHPATTPVGRQERARVASPGNCTPAVVDLEALRKRAAQLRAARGARDAPRLPFDWNAE